VKRLATAAVLAALALGLAACQGQGVPAGSSDTPSSAPSTEPTSTGSPPQGASGGDCRPDDLDPRPYYGVGGASGSSGQHVAVRNASATPCRLATFPTLVSTDTGGTSRPLAADRYPWDGNTDQPSVLLAPGGYADLMAFHAGGWSGYSPGDPRCAHPVDHTDLSVLLAGGRPYPLPGLDIAVQCAALSVRAWEPLGNPQTDLPNPHRAPAPGADAATCRTADLDPRPYYGTGGGAMGRVGWYVMVHNITGKPCALGTYPMLDDSGKPARQEATTEVKALVLPPGRYARFLVIMVNGYGTLAPGDPACQQPQDYRNLSVELDAGQHFALSGLELNLRCSDLKVGPWEVTDLASLPMPTRAP
jgi:hypothetical protein